MIDGLTAKEWEFLKTSIAAVPRDQWPVLFSLHEKRADFIRHENEKYKLTKTKKTISIDASVLSDDLGLHGVLNHADKKFYDSKSEFRKATRRAGCYEIGNDIKREHIESHKRETQGDFNVRPQLKEALQKVIGT